MKSKIYRALHVWRSTRQVSFMLHVEVLRQCAKGNVDLWAKEYVSLQRIFGIHLTQVYEIVPIKGETDEISKP